MRKIVCVLLCFVTLFSLASCTKTKTITGDAPVVTTTEETEKEDFDDMVKIELPLAVIDKEFQNDLDGYCQQYGYKSAKLNEKTQIVTVKMTKLAYDLLLTKVGLQVIKAVYQVQEGGEYPCVKEITKFDDKNFKSVVISVDAQEYKKEGDTAAYIIGQCCLLYQLYASDGEYKCEVVINDAETGKLIESKVYTDKE